MTFIAIDLKSFYASVECVDRGLDPLTTNLVVADSSRTEKTICLAVSPSLKSYGISGRARLYEVVQRVKAINSSRKTPLEYIVAPPRMARYMEVSAKVFATYLKYVSQDDILVYSCDEIFADVTHYLDRYKCTARELAVRMIRDVLSTTGITATAGIGTNLFLAKIAMDIKAKHQKADAEGVRIAELDEASFRREMWSHEPLTDFWRVGRGTASRLQANGIRTMGDLARKSLIKGERAWLYRQFGVNAELLIDHAWGYEPCTMAAIKAYRPQTNSLSSGQVLKEPYTFTKARTVLREMVDSLTLDLVSKKLKTDQIVISVCYDTECAETCSGVVVKDWYGRPVPKPAHGSVNLGRFSSSTSHIMDSVVGLYDKIVDKNLTIRRLNVAANHLISDDEAERRSRMTLFGEPQDDSRERKMQESILAIKEKFGKNSILKGTSFDDGATAKERNGQIGGHKA